MICSKFPIVSGPIFGVLPEPFRCPFCEYSLLPEDMCLAVVSDLVCSQCEQLIIKIEVGK